MLKKVSSQRVVGRAPLAPRLAQLAKPGTGRQPVVAAQEANPETPSDILDLTELPRRRRYGTLLSFALMVLVPTALAGYYYSQIATPQYVSEFHFGVRSADAARNDATSIFQGMAAASQIGLDSYMIVQFVKSREMLEYVESHVDVAKIFGRSDIDYLSRLPANASIEQKVAYWQKHVEPYFDLTTGSMTTRVSSFKPEDSQAIGKLIIERAQLLINETSKTIRDDALRAAQEEVQRAEVRLTAAISEIADFRAKAGRINPAKEAEVGLQGSEQLTTELARAKAQLSVQKSYLPDNSLAVRATEKRIAALNEQIQSIKKEVSGTQQKEDGSPGLAEDIGTFDTLALEQKFAEQNYTLALTAMERAKQQAEKQVGYLSVFIRPTLPGSSTYPDPIEKTFIALIAAFAFWFVSLIFLKSIREK